MVTVNHSSIGDPYIHEPKGVSTAQTSTVYVANGSGSGSWKSNHQHLGVYLTYSTAAPYQLATLTTDTILDPTFNVGSTEGFVVDTAPNMRLKYNGTDPLDAHLLFNFSSKTGSHSDEDVEWALFKNGVEVSGSRTVRTLNSSAWGSMSVAGYTSLVSSDYIEIKSKATALVTVSYAAGTVSIMGVTS